MQEKNPQVVGVEGKTSLQNRKTGSVLLKQMSLDRASIFEPRKGHEVDAAGTLPRTAGFSAGAPGSCETRDGFLKISANADF